MDIIDIISVIYFLFTLIIAQVDCQQTKHFNVYWNVPTQGCLEKYGIKIDAARYGMSCNIYDGWTGENITIFPQLGVYPSVSANGTVLNGGIPQKANLAEHQYQIHHDIKKHIPDSEFHGLAIIDYEAWRPIWERNWDEKEIYKKLSMELVKKYHPDWSDDKVKKVAVMEFEDAARKFLETTINSAKVLRPKGKWGFYHYPYCFNHFEESKCSHETLLYNNKIIWLFESSTALYPSAYLENSSNSTANANHVHGEVQEAKRIQHLLMANGTSVPVYMYSRFRYRDGSYYTKRDLVSSILQASQLGVEGVVLWDDHHLSDTREACVQVQHYLQTILGPFVANIIHWNA